MLLIEGVNKTYSGGVQALRGVDLAIEPGVFGLLGPNGAGKSTLMKILATLLHADAGTVRLNDVDIARDPHAARRMIGYLPQHFGFYPSFTARQMLHFFARLKGVTDKAERERTADHLLEMVNLAREADDRVDTFSGGMLQRLGIAQAMIASPRLLIVDEPTSGLDPEERARFHNLLAELADRDTVVFLSTHLVTEAAALCASLAIILDGEVLAHCTPADAVARLHGRVAEGVIPRTDRLQLGAGVRTLARHIQGDTIRLRVLSDDVQALPTGFAPVSPTLEDFYMSMMTSRS